MNANIEKSGRFRERYIESEKVIEQLHEQKCVHPVVWSGVLDWRRIDEWQRAVFTHKFQID